MAMTRAQWVLIALALTSSAGAAQPGLPRGLGVVRADVERLVDDVRREGLRADLVVLKAHEGAAKSVEPQRILAAARAVASDLRLADRIARKRAVRPDGRAEVIAAGVAAHRAGISLAGIDAIVGDAPRHEPAAAVRALQAAADLGGRGYPRDAAVALVRALLARDARDAELPRVLAAVEAVRRADGSSPADALAKVARAVESGQDLQQAGRGTGP
jgi:hypothetical protein